MILRVENVSKRFGQTVALDDVSFAFDSGICGLLGANGAGKSTLYRAILDLVRPDRGTIAVDGLDVVRRSLEARRRVGYLPEELKLYERLTGGELLSFVAGLKGLDNAGERDEWLAFFGLGERRDVLIGEYSLGMRKKIGLIAALMGEPRLVLLDEPLNGLDTESMRRLRLRIEAMAARGTSFLLSSHTMAFVARVCPRVLVLRRGRLVADGSPASLRAESGLDDFEDVFLRLADILPETPSGESQ